MCKVKCEQKNAIHLQGFSNFNVAKSWHTAWIGSTLAVFTPLVAMLLECRQKGSFTRITLIYQKAMEAGINEEGVKML